MIRMSIKICLVIVALFGGVGSAQSEENFFGWYDYSYHCDLYGKSCDWSGRYKFEVEFTKGTSEVRGFYKMQDVNNSNANFEGVISSLRYFGQSNGSETLIGKWIDKFGEGKIELYSKDAWASMSGAFYFDEEKGVKLFLKSTKNKNVIRNWVATFLNSVEPPTLSTYPLKDIFSKHSQSKRKLIQRNLKDLGLYTSSIDGLYGKGTAAALTAYNKKHLSASDLKVAANVKKLMDKVLALATAAKPITASETVRFKQIKEEFGLNYYGGFIHSDRVPNTLFFFTDIQQNDSFEFRKALRNHDIELIVLTSPGGSVFEGLQTAGIIHDKNLKTYIPKKSLYGSGNCASACSFMFFAGASRSAEGDLGVHQFYSGKASDEEKIRATQKRAQFTVSEIIGFLNEFDTPAWVFERMFQQADMYYFKENELSQLETEISDATKLLHEKAEIFISDFRSAFVKIKD